MDDILIAHKASHCGSNQLVVTLQDCLAAIDRAAKEEREECIEIAEKCGIEAFCTPYHKEQAEGYRRDVVRALKAGTYKFIDPYKGD